MTEQTNAVAVVETSGILEDKQDEILGRRVERALDYDKFLEDLPILHVVAGLSGKNEDGRKFELDPGHKVAIHEFPQNDETYTIPYIRSESYKELSHDHVFNTIHESLEGAGLQHKVLNHRFSRNTGDLHADIVIVNKQYKIDEKIFEADMGNVVYTPDDKKNRGLYLPVIRIRNSFIQSSKILNGLLRVICSNGMVGVNYDEAMLPLTFAHIGDVMGEFESGVDNLIQGMLTRNLIERMMEAMGNDMVSFGAFLHWMINSLGPQATEISVEQFKMQQRQLEDQMSKWVAFNVATWAMSNVIESVTRRDRAQRQLNTFIEKDADVIEAEYQEVLAEAA